MSKFYSERELRSTLSNPEWSREELLDENYRYVKDSQLKNIKSRELTLYAPK